MTQSDYLTTMPAALSNVERWRLRAACRSTDPRIFFPTASGKSTKSEAAKAVCARCPVQDECLNYALKHQIRDGIWAGLNYGERLEVRRAARSGRGGH